MYLSIKIANIILFWFQGQTSMCNIIIFIKMKKKCYLLDNGCDTTHIFIRRVGTTADEAILDFQGPAVFLGGFAQLSDRGGQIRSERAIHMGLQGVQVDLDQLIVLAVGIWSQQNVLVFDRFVGNVATASSLDKKYVSLGLQTNFFFAKLPQDNPTCVY